MKKGAGDGEDEDKGVDVALDEDGGDDLGGCAGVVRRCAYISRRISRGRLNNEGGWRCDCDTDSSMSSSSANLASASCPEGWELVIPAVPATWFGITSSDCDAGSWTEAVETPVPTRRPKYGVSPPANPVWYEVSWPRSSVIEVLRSWALYCLISYSYEPIIFPIPLGRDIFSC